MANADQWDSLSDRTRRLRGTPFGGIHTGPVVIELPADYGPVIDIRSTGDNNSRFRVDTDGDIHIGSGNGAPDLMLSRGDDGSLRINGVSIGGAVAATAVRVQVDFGHPDGGEDSYAVTTVADATVAEDSHHTCFPSGATTADHDGGDAALEGLAAYVANIVEGVSYDVVAYVPGGTWGRYLIDVVG